MITIIMSMMRRSFCPPRSRSQFQHHHPHHTPPPQHYEESQQFSHREGYDHHPEDQGHHRDTGMQRQDRSDDDYEQGPSREFPRDERGFDEHREEKPVKKRRVAPPKDRFDD